MPDDIKTAIDAATDTTKAAIDTAGQAAKKTTDTVESASKQQATVADKAIKTATKATKRAPKATKRAAKATKNAKTAKRRAKSTRRTTRKTRTTRPAAKTAAAGGNERINDMNFDSNNWFAGFGAMPSTPFQSMFADAGERGQEAVRRSQKATEEFAAMTRANVEAMVNAGKIAAEGARSIGQDAVDSGREGVEQVAETVRSLAEAKSPTEYVQLQTEFVRASFDRAVSESSRMTESMVKLAGEAFRPLSNRASVNAERLNKFVA